MNMHRAQKSLYIAERKAHRQDEVNQGQLPGGQHVKNWRPQVLAFVDAEIKDGEWSISQDALLDVLSTLRKGGMFYQSNELSGGFTTVVSILIGNVSDTILHSESLQKIKNALHNECVSRKLEVSVDILRRFNHQAFTNVLVSPSLKYGMISASQCVGVGMLKPNTILIGFLSDKSPSSCDRYVDILRAIIALDKVVMIAKGLENFPDTRDQQTGTIDVYWVIHDGGILTLIAHLLMRHHVWRNCKLRIFAVAQLTDNSVEMKRNLLQSLQRLRINADCDVLELGDFDVSQFAYEKTMMLRSREEFLRKIEDSNVLNMPSSSHKRRDSSGSVKFSRKLSLSRQIFKGFGLSNENDSSPRNGDSGPLDAPAIIPPTRSEEPSPEQHLLLGGKTPVTPRSAAKMDENVAMMNTAVKLNALMNQNSGPDSDCSLVLCNLPAPSDKKEGSNSIAYIEYLTTLTEGLPRLMLLKGTGSEVVTTYL